MSILNDPGVQKVWMGDHLIYDRATDSRHPMDVLALALFGGAEHCGTGIGEGLSKGADEIGIEGA